MNHKSFFLWLAFFGALAVTNLSAQGTAFSYQGQLATNGTAATGAFDFEFNLVDTNSNVVAGPETNLAVVVKSGVFMTTLNFGAVFTGSNYWLAIGVRTNNGVGNSTNAFTQLLPVQPLLPVPYAIFSTSASNLLGTLSSTQLSGPLLSAQLTGTFSNSVTFSNSANSFIGNFSGTFSGNGLGLTDLNGSLIATGTVADARLSTNVALLNGIQTFTQANTFSNPTNSFTGSFFGNGLVGWIPISGNSVQAVRDTGYLALNANLTTILLPQSTNLFVGDIVRISGGGSGGWKVAQNANQSIAGIFFSPTNATWTRSGDNGGGWWALASSANGLKQVGSQGGSGGIYTSADGGVTWKASTASATPSKLASSGDGAHLIGCVYNGNIQVSSNSGTSWTGEETSQLWSGVASSFDGSAFAACISNNTIGVWTNYGSTVVSSAAPSLAWCGVTMSANGTRLAAAAVNKNIYYSVNAGVNWTQSSSGAFDWTCIASSSDGLKLAAAVYNGHIYTSTDGGATWTSQANSPVLPWTAIATSSDGGRIVGVASNSVAYISADFGADWTAQAVSPQLWRAVTCSADGSDISAGYSTTLTAGGIDYWHASAESTVSTTGVTGSMTGGPGSAVELQYIGNNVFMPVSSIGVFWSN